MSDYSYKHTDYGQLSLFPEIQPNILLVPTNLGREVIKITATGELYWNGRLVETDEDFKLAMLDLAEHFKRR